MISAEPSHFESLYPADSRFSEIEKILSFIKSGNSVQVISLIGVGRSNVLRILAYNHAVRTLHLGENQKWFHFVMMNFAEIKKRPLKDSTKYIFLELVESLSARKMNEEHKHVKDLFDQSLKSGDEMVIFQGLKKTIDYLCLEKELTVVLLFDRFEEYVGVVEPVFFDHLRVLRDRAKYRFSCIFPLNRPLEETVGNEIISSFYEFLVGNLVYLTLGDEKIRNFRLSYLKKTTGKKIDEKVLEEVLKLTGGLGKLWLVSLESCLNSNVTIEQLNNLAGFLMDQNRVRAVLLEIWKSLSPYEQSLIEQKKAHESSHLVAVGLVKNNKFSVPLLESFAKSQGPLETREKILYDPATNEIKKGDLVLSEGLTSSEFKLLKFLVQNEGKILDRDSVVNAVWADLSSTAGVSEQALDQLIFRLRKKIEENPNSPTHIQTIKGRGFKFLP
ncbi:MAG: winged helix-turn-helix domain-containing protein [Candidatus Levybacteria bacterium]|nr:winged helix-turn-helix domain-containing protein [Candidatus Levybacteria bacterium]